MSKFHSLRGMSDVSFQEAAVFTWIENRAREVYKIFGFAEIRTPILELTEVFTRSIGENTDIVEKEIYSFNDRGGKNISLRPEGTASIIRAYIEHGWNKENDLVKLFYCGPMFRGERPQKGRQRQFHQIGAEIIGARSPFIDAELILNLEAFLGNLGIKGSKLLINSLGCRKDRTAYISRLKEYIGTQSSLCENCVKRFVTNPLRVLDCKRESCKKILKNAPVITDSLCEECSSDYLKLKQILDDAKTSYIEKPDLVRGLDYYTGTVFEVTHSSLGAQDAIAAGGRYDDLAKQMGGPDVGAVGYAAGIERLLLVIDKDTAIDVAPGVLVVPVGESTREVAFEVVNAMRKEGIACDINYAGKTLKSGMRKANKEGRKYVVLIGENEIASKKVTLKNMDSGEQELLTIAKVIEKLGRG
jgi:histidyl-tRNA synthetase